MASVAGRGKPPAPALGAVTQLWTLNHGPTREQRLAQDTAVHRPTQWAAIDQTLPVCFETCREGLEGRKESKRKNRKKKSPQERFS